MKLKKVISVMLVGACVFSMAACGSKKEEAKKIESADDLKDAKIGVQTGTTGDIYCSDDFGDDHVERFNKGADAVQALVKGKIDAVVIDNSDSYLKVPYTEISITRKVYRSGENEYYINGEKCRLKDIGDLFLDSGIGKYAFNIISQGEVANIINSSPYDRRGIFEEAAGVLKYKKRKSR